MFPEWTGKNVAPGVQRQRCNAMLLEERVKPTATQGAPSIEAFGSPAVVCKRFPDFADAAVSHR